MQLYELLEQKGVDFDYHGAAAGAADTSHASGAGSGRLREVCQGTGKGVRA